MASSKSMKVMVLLGSVRDGRFAERVGIFVAEKLKAAKHDVEVLDPLHLNLPLLKQPLQFYPDPSKAPQIVRDLNEKVKKADAYVLVTPEYNRSMPPPLTNLIDHFPPRSFGFKASGIVTYSLGSGGWCGVAQARTLMVEMGALPVPFVWQIPDVHKKLDASGKPLDDWLHKNADKLITQLNWYGGAMKTQRDNVGEPEWGPTLSI